MRGLKVVISSLIFSLAFLQCTSKGWEFVDLTEGDYNIPDPINHPNWASIDLLNIYKDVTITMRNTMGGGSVDVFNMYDNSKLTLYDGFISTLNIYPDASAIVRGGDIHYLWIDPATTG